MKLLCNNCELLLAAQYFRKHNSKKYLVFKFWVFNSFKTGVPIIHSVHPPFCRKGGGGWGETSTGFSKKRGWGLGRTSIFRGGCWERGADLFQLGCSFYIKNKLKSEIFYYKKVYKQIFFSMITKNLDWKTLTKNSVTFKRWDGLKDGLIL